MSKLKRNIAFIVSDENETLVRDFIQDHRSILSSFTLLVNATKDNLTRGSIDYQVNHLPFIENGIDELIAQLNEVNPVIVLGYPSICDKFPPEMLARLVMECTRHDVDVVFNTSGAQMIVGILGDFKSYTKKTKKVNVSKSEQIEYLEKPLLTEEVPTVDKLLKMSKIGMWSMQQINGWTEDYFIHFLRPHLLPAKYREIDQEVPDLSEFYTNHTDYFTYNPLIEEVCNEDTVNSLLENPEAVKNLEYSLSIQFTTVNDAIKYLVYPVIGPLRQFWNYPLFVKTFLLCYTTFTDSITLINGIIEEYDNATDVSSIIEYISEYNGLFPEPDEFDREDIDLFNTRPSIIELLKCWIRIEFGSEFRENTELYNITSKFVSETVKIDYPEDANEIEQDLKVILSISVPYPFATGKKPKVLGSSKKSLNSRSVVFSFNPIEIARQLTLIDEVLFHRIRAKEFLGNAWMKKDAIVRAPNLTAFINHSNKLTAWIKSEAVKIVHKEEHMEYISLWIRIGKELLELKNYSGLMSVLTALHSATISRLRLAWQDVPTKERKDFEFLTDSVSLVGNFTNYRESIMDIQEREPIIPLAAVTCSDINGLSEVFETKVVDGLVPFENLGKYAKNIWKLIKFQRAKYSLQEDKDIQTKLMEAMDDDKIEGESTLDAIAKLRNNNPDGPGEEGTKLVKKMSRKTLKKMKHKSSKEVENNTSLEMTDDDWLILNEGKAPEVYPQDKEILTAGSINQHLYRITKGKVRVEKNGVKVATMSTGQIFGEISMLLSSEQARATATILADSEKVDCQKIEFCFS
eukprot:TRINITY_DN1485_c0_g1_i1.p1 TRINITY_DN1485_c0_g1~~TRINITY_DN1485_c0_g1_i1.p1  ORF type:complete len:812 (+),score=179.59 TRINITY_DN1485_c0_g1_i1:28-2436(+)